MNEGRASAAEDDGIAAAKNNKRQRVVAASAAAAGAPLWHIGMHGGYNSIIRFSYAISGSIDSDRMWIA